MGFLALLNISLISCKSSLPLSSLSSSPAFFLVSVSLTIRVQGITVILLFTAEVRAEMRIPDL
jgi:hypothetical protein